MGTLRVHTARCTRYYVNGRRVSVGIYWYARDRDTTRTTVDNVRGIVRHYSEVRNVTLNGVPTPVTDLLIGTNP